MNKVCLIILQIICFTISGCQYKTYPVKDFKCYFKPVPKGAYYDNLPTPDTTTIYKYPIFNPSNPNEFIYIKKEVSYPLIQINPNEKLILYNLKNKSQKLISDSLRLFSSNWSKSGLVYSLKVNYEKHTSHPILINVNTQNEKKLNCPMNISYKTWDKTGKKLISLGGLCFSPKGDTLKTIISIKNEKPYPYYRDVSCSDKNLLAFVGRGLTIIDFNSDKIIYKNNEPIRGFSISWLPDNKHVIWNCYLKGINITNIKTGKTILLRKNCDNRRYETLSVSSNGKFIICTRVEIDVKRNKRKSNICMMQINGKEEKLIRLDK